MPHARIDCAAADQPAPGDTFTITQQENSELLGLLDGGRTFRFKTSGAREQDYHETNQLLRVVELDLEPQRSGEARLVGSLTYAE